jgi:Leucine-rich repeat (LRR) protein
MHRSIAAKLVTMAFMLCFFARVGAIDQVDSLTVRDILDQIGWTGVPVDSVYNKQISITSSTRVTNLTLSGRTGLPKMKQLPSAIGKLPELQSLSLSGNELSTLPEELTSLLKLRQLNIASNAFTKLPDPLGGIPSLQLLDASHNQIDSLPAFIEKLASLMILDAHANRILYLPSQIQSLTSLKSLSLMSNRLERLPVEIAGLTALELLSCDSNALVTLPSKITALQNVKIGVSGNRLCTLSDQSLVAWLNAHQLTPEWRATQNCNDTGFSAIITDVVTGTVVTFSSTFMPAKTVTSVLSVASVSAVPAAPSGNQVLKMVNIQLDPVFKNQINSFLITIPFSEERYADIEVAQLSIYFYDGQQWVYFGGTVNASKRTISVRTGKEGMYALMYNVNRVPVRRPSGSKKVPFAMWLSPSTLFLTPGPTASPAFSIAFLTLTGRVISRHTIVVQGNNERVAVKLPGALAGKPCIVVITNGKEKSSRLLPLP